MKSNKEIEEKFLPAMSVELPSDMRMVMAKAKRYERITFFYLLSVAVLMYFTMSSSQAMKAAWLEDILSIIPSVIFLIASRYYTRDATFLFPYGFHRVFSIGFGFGSFALLAMGIFIATDSLITLIKAEHATIEHITILGYTFWHGWVMLVVLLYSFVPAVILGKKKIKLAEKLHNKLMMVDAEAQKADWMTAGAAVVGIVGIGFGWWWADPIAALFISISILKDGVRRFYDAIADFLGRIPTTVKNEEIHPVNKTIIEYLEKQNWITDFRMRLREEGEVFLGEVFVIPEDGNDLIEKIEKCCREIKELDWKIHEIAIQPVKGFVS